jgi:hypothetical protein
MELEHRNEEVIVAFENGSHEFGRSWEAGEFESADLSFSLPPFLLTSSRYCTFSKIK